MSDDIQRLVESLRSPGLESELRGESFAVDAIASTMTAKDASMNNRFSKKARVASFIAAGIIGFSGVAAAGPAAMELVVGTDGTDDEPIAIEEESTEENLEEGTDQGTGEGTEGDTKEGTEGDAEGADEEGTGSEGEREPDEGADADGADENEDETVLVDDPDTAFDETECQDGNHGKTVSHVARTEGRTSQQVVDAAQSTCGKKTGTGEEGIGVDETDDDAVLVDDPDTAFDETECQDGNHGKTVSEVARTEGRTSQQVVDAAQSTCGKKTGDSEDAEANEDAEGAEDDAGLVDEPQDDEQADGDDDAPDTVEADDDRNSRDGNGGSNGNGRGNGNSGNGKANGNGGNSNSGNSKATGNSGNGNGRGGK